MLTDELTTLITIEAIGKLSKRPTSCSMEISYGLINYICNALLSRGHLVENGLGGYQVTSQGKGVILGETIRLIVCDDEAWVICRMERLEQLFDEISQLVDNFVGKQQRGSLDVEYSIILRTSARELANN